MDKEMKDVKKIFTEYFKKIGMKSKNSSWYGIHQTVIHVINLQKSSFGNQYYINIGISPTSIIENEFLPFNKFPFRFRIENIDQNYEENQTFLDLDNEQVSTTDFEKEVKKALDFCMNFLNGIRDESELKILLQKNSYIRNFAMRRLLDYFNL